MLSSNTRLTKFSSWLFFSLLLIVITGRPQKYNRKTERRISDLIVQMTLAEKLGQLQQLGDDQGRATTEDLEMARKGLLGSTLGCAELSILTSCSERRWNRG